MLVSRETIEPLYKRMGIFTEASTGRRKRKPKLINAMPSRSLTDYTKDSDLDEVDLDNIDADDISMDDLEDYTSGLDDELNSDDYDDEELPDDSDLDDVFNKMNTMLDDNQDSENQTPGENTSTDDNQNNDQDASATDDGNQDSNAEPENTDQTDVNQSDNQNDEVDVNDNQDTDQDTSATDNVNQDGQQDNSEEPPEDLDIPDGSSTDTNNDDTEETIPQDNEDVDDQNQQPDQQPEDTTQPQEQQQPGSPKAFKKEDMLKYILFQRFTRLHSSITKYIKKLETNTSDNDKIKSSNYQIRQKFQELSSLVYDYLVLKYSSDSYMSNKYFYEQTKTAILILFQLLNNSHNEENNGK